MKMSELDRVVAISLTSNGEVNKAKEMVKGFLDQHTPQEKADLLCFQWVIPVKSEEEFGQVLDALVNHKNICNQEEADVIKKQYKFQYDSSIEAVGLACYKLNDYFCISVLYDTDVCNEKKITFDEFDYEYGVLCHVNNLDMPDYSESGSVMFMWVGDGYQKA